MGPSGWIMQDFTPSVPSKLPKPSLLPRSAAVVRRSVAVQGVTRYLFAAAIVALATVLRILLNPVFGDRFPFAFFFGCVLISAWIAGIGPGILAMVLGGIVVDVLGSP